ncbi:MAG: sensor histidine kinase [Elainellaceae cyanobacterium]
MLELQTGESLSPNLEPWQSELTLDSTLQDLRLYDFQLDLSSIGQEVAERFSADPLLPGTILVAHNKFVGMLSRQRFFAQMSQPYSLELFLERSLYSLHTILENDALVLSGTMPIVEAAQQSLQRPRENLYEPIVVQLNGHRYGLLDIHQLLLAQSTIHQLTTRLLNEKTQAYLIQTEKMASLGRMVAGISHEIKNPVNCIHGNLNFLVQYSQELIDLIKVYQYEFPQKSRKIQDFERDIELEFLSEDLFKLLKSMNLAGDRLVEIVSSLRNFSRLDQDTKQLIDIHECIEGTLLILNSRLKQGIDIVREYGEIPQITCYAGQISQVFMNIISNSIEALLEKVNQADSSEKSWHPQIKIKTQILDNHKTDWVSICIADNANGIPPDIQTRVFEAFFTTKPIGEGTGLGLAISHQIVTQKHHGTLSVTSQPNVGTEFKVQLPLSQIDTLLTSAVPI